MNTEAAQKLALELMEKYSLTPHWTFRFGRSTRTYGKCYGWSRIIELSAPLTLSNTEAHVRDTILHEIAHALTSGHGHDEVWQNMAVKLGASPLARSEGEAPSLSKGYRATCSGCGTVAVVATRPRRYRSCRKCGGGVFNMKFLLNYVRFDSDGTPEVPARGDGLLTWLATPEETGMSGNRLYRYRRSHGDFSPTSFYAAGGRARDLARYVKNGWVKIG